MPGTDNRMPYEKRWTPREDATLLKLSPELTGSLLGERLGRSESAIHSRWWKLGVRKRKAAPWLPHELDVLRSLITNREAAMTLCRSIDAVISKRRELRIPRKRKARENLWTAAEDEKLRQLFGTLTTRQISGELPGRSLWAVRSRARLLGLAPIKSR